MGDGELCELKHINTPKEPEGLYFYCVLSLLSVFLLCFQALVRPETVILTCQLLCLLNTLIIIFKNLVCVSIYLGGVSWSSDLWGDSEHLALRDNAAAWQLPAGGHTSELHQLWLSQWGRGGARGSWASGTCPSNTCQEVQHVWRPATRTLRLKPQTTGQISTFHMKENSNIKSVDAHIFLSWIVLLSFVTTIWEVQIVALI